MHSSNRGKEWVQLAAAWKNKDGSLQVTLTEYLKPGEKIFLRPNKFKKPGDRRPNYTYSVKASQYDEKEGEVLREDSKPGSEIF